MSAARPHPARRAAAPTGPSAPAPAPEPHPPSAMTLLPCHAPAASPCRTSPLARRRTSRCIAVAVAVVLSTLAAVGPAPVHAGPGHDHGHDDAPAAAAGPALPRFAATSDLFELVGVLDGRTLTLFLDASATNAPVGGASLELEIGGRVVPVQAVAAGAPAAAGDFTATLAEPLPEGVHPVTVTVTTAKDADLLAGEIDIHAPTPSGAHDHGGWLEELWAHRRAWVLGGGAAFAVAAVAGLALTRRRRADLRDGRPA